MVAWKPFARGVLACVALTGWVHADTLTWANGMWGQSRIRVYQQDSEGGQPAGSTGAVPNPSSAPPPPAASAPALAPPPSSPADAFVNLGAGPYPEQGLITTGGAQPWYNSPQLVNLFGGPPTAQQQQSFDNAVIQRVEQTFQLAGIPLTLTSNPNVPAAHTLSIVSNTSSSTFPNAIGTTDVGGSGFTFIDPIAKSAQSVDQLAWIVAHNVSHELMLAFGVPEKYDQTGNFIDATHANWSMLTSPTATFSPGAAQALLTQMGAAATNSAYQPGAQMMGPAPVPEPATVALWVAAMATLGLARGKKGAAR